MSKQICHSCNGVYYEDESKNEMIILQMKTIENCKNVIEGSDVLTNQNLLKNAHLVLSEAQQYLASLLGSKSFCKCVHKRTAKNMEESQYNYFMKKFKDDIGR